jgi:hypothetical protein
MKKLMYTLLVATVSFGLTAYVARGQERAREREELDSRARTVNNLASRRGGMRDALHDVSVETGVPLDRVQRMHDDHPNAGAAGIMIACVMADNTKGSPNRFLEDHKSGRSWASIARQNNVPLEKINAKLDNLERELNQGLPASGAPRGGYGPSYNRGYQG